MNSKNLLKIDSKKTTIYDCSILHLPKIENRAGNITPLENLKNIPFEIKRVFYIYDIPGGKDRGAHAHKVCKQLLIAASGGFDVFLDDGINKKTVTLNRPYLGLYIIPGMWRELLNLSSGSISLVLASDYYNENDYIRKYEDFLNFKTYKA